MMNQNIMFKLTLTLSRNHPSMFGEFMKMSQLEVAEFIHDTYGVVLSKGTSWNDVNVIVNVMEKQYQARIEG